MYAGGAWALMGRSLVVGLGGLVSGWLCVGLGVGLRDFVKFVQVQAFSVEFTILSSDF